MDYEHDFWTSDHRYEDFVRTYERNIELTHPPFVTSDGAGSRFCYYCQWGATAVTYYEYNGPRPSSASAGH